jgi:hypothetical protein
MDGSWNLFRSTGNPVFYLLYQERQRENHQKQPPAVSPSPAAGGSV